MTLLAVEGRGVQKWYRRIRTMTLGIWDAFLPPDLGRALVVCSTHGGWRTKWSSRESRCVSDEMQRDIFIGFHHRLSARAVISPYDLRHKISALCVFNCFIYQLLDVSWRWSLSLLIFRVSESPITSPHQYTQQSEASRILRINHDVEMKECAKMWLQDDVPAVFAATH